MTLLYVKKKSYYEVLACHLFFSNDILTLLCFNTFIWHSMCQKNNILLWDIYVSFVFILSPLSSFSLPYLSPFSFFSFNEEYFFNFSLSSASNIHLYCISILISNKQHKHGGGWWYLILLLSTLAFTTSQL